MIRTITAYRAMMLEERKPEFVFFRQIGESSFSWEEFVFQRNHRAWSWCALPQFTSPRRGVEPFGWYNGLLSGVRV